MLRTAITAGSTSPRPERSGRATQASTRMGRRITATDRMHAARRGFTLVEATMAMVILGLAAAGVLLPFSGAARIQAEGIHSTVAAELANDLMERIAATSYADIVTSWNGYSEARGGVTDSTGTVLTDPIYARFSRDVTCEAVTVWPQSATTVSYFIRASVRVYDEGRLVVTLNRLISE
ncbi:MAG: type IV pilus modification PilV family protein [Solirubrobacterales bacterium]